MFISGERYSKKQEQQENLKNFINTNLLEEGRVKWLTNKSGKKLYRDPNDNKKIFELNLEKRRMKLRALLQSEQDYYIELLNIQSKKDPEEKIIQMREKYEKIKERNDVEKKKEIERLKEIHFRQNADELRLVDKKVDEYKCKIEQEIQMLEKHKILEEKFQEDLIYHEIEVREAKKKDLLEKKKQKEKLAKLKEKNEQLQNQIQEIKIKRKQEIEDMEKEKKNLQQKWARDRKEEEEKFAKQKMVNKKIAEEIKNHNLLQQMEKENEMKNEKIRDKIMVDQEIKREKILKDLEEKQKENYQREIRNFFTNMKNQKEELKINQNLLEQLLKKEMDRQWKKRQEIWDREEQARIALMKNVYEDRFENIENKKKQKIDQKKFILKEKEEMDKKVRAFEEEEKNLAIKEILKIQNYRDVIINQIFEKYLQREKEINDEIEEERKRKLKELEYNERIENEKRKGMELLEEIKRLRNTIY